MAEPSKPLLRIGPFTGYDTTTAAPYANHDTATSGSSNVDTERYPGAMVTSRGRINLTTLTGNGNVQAITHYNYGAVPERSIVASLTGTVQRYNITTPAQSLVASANAFTQAVQFGDVLYTNAGQQIRAASSYGAYWWAGVSNLGNITASSVLTGAGNLISGAYTYFFTTQFRYPDGGLQESLPEPNAGFVPSTVGTSLTANGWIVLKPTAPDSWWYGTAADGSTYTTNVYRRSNNQPTYFFAGNVNSGTPGVSATSGTYTDNAADATIATATQLQFRYLNPLTLALLLSGTNNAPIFKHKERMFVFMLFNAPGITSATQSQLWYSDAGIPWSFFAGSQSLLVGSDADNAVVATGTLVVNYAGLLNDVPMAGVSLSSVAILHKRRTTWILYGDDPSTFVPRKMWDIGTVSSGSATVCGDVDCWLSEDGPQMTDGAQRQYIGEQVKAQLATIPQTDWVNSVGWYADRTWHLSFPATGITLRYYLPSSKWLVPLPYATNAAYSLPSESSPVGLVRLQEVIAVEPATKVIDAWNCADGTDLGARTTSTWVGQLSDGGVPGMDKAYTYVVMYAPVQAQVLATGTLVIDGKTGTNTHKWIFDLAQGPKLIATVPENFIGTDIRFTIDMQAAPTNVLTGSAPAIIYAVEVHGTVERNLVPTQSGGVTGVT